MADESFIEKVKIFLTADNKQRIAFLIKASLELFKISIGCFLVVFVPQSCGSHTCTFQENVAELDNGFNIFALVFNLFTFLVLLGHYAVDLARENWLIQHFDVDQEVGDNALKAKLGGEEPAYAPLRDGLALWNKRLLLASVAMVGVFVCNLSFSAATILHFYYDGFRSATVLLTNTLLVLQRVQRVATVSLESYKGDLALSTALTEALSYNVVDKEIAAEYEAAAAKGTAV